MKTRIFSAIVLAFTTSVMVAQPVTNNLSSFNRISISRSAKIIIKQGNTYSISASDEQVLNEVQYRQDGNRLLFAGNSAQEVTITTDDIKQIDIAGSGTVATDGLLKAGEIELNISGNGRTNLQVDAQKLVYNVSGNCNGNISGKPQKLN